MPDVRTLLDALLGHADDPATRAELLGRVILVLLMEVESLRRAVEELSNRAGPADAEDDVLAGPRHGMVGPRTAYAAACAETAWLTHCAAGPTDGWEKLLAEFYSSGHAPTQWRECLMLKRLGFSDADLAQYMESARNAETYT